MIPVSSLSPALSPEQLNELLERQEALTVLDVLTPAEYESVHIAGSYNVPLDQLSEHAGELASSVGGPVVLISRSGMRARQAEQTLRAADLPRLHVLEGGIAAWEARGLPVNRGTRRWSMERQVRGVAGGIALTGALAGLFLWRPLGGISAFIGGGLLASALTDTCTMARLLSKLPYNASAGQTCDIDAVVREIAGAPGPNRAAD